MFNFQTIQSALEELLGISSVEDRHEEPPSQIDESTAAKGDLKISGNQDSGDPSDDDSLKEKKRRKNKRTHGRQKARKVRQKEEDRRDENEIATILIDPEDGIASQNDYEEAKAKLNEVEASIGSKFLTLFTGQKMTVVPCKRQPDYVKELQQLENLRSEPLDLNDPDFPKPLIVIDSVGTKLLYDDELNALVCLIRVTPFDSMSLEEKKDEIEVLETLSQLTDCTQIIRNNSSMTKPHGAHLASNTAERTPHGVMSGAGWHASNGEQGKTLTTYAAKPGHGKEYEILSEKLPQAARNYRNGLLTLFPNGVKMLDRASEENRLPSFASGVPFTSIDGEDFQRPFANSLTITRNDFSNYQHRDRDKIAIAYGKWWVGRKKDGVWSVDETICHSEIEGGAFLIGEYGTLIQFEKMGASIVEIFWRGRQDFHSTMLSKTTNHNITRFGSSIQITKKGSDAVAKFWRDGGDSKRVVDREERVVRARTLRPNSQQRRGASSGESSRASSSARSTHAMSSRVASTSRASSQSSQYRV